MRIKKETKANADLQVEFSVARYLWGFATQWFRAKTTNRLADFWANVGTTLESYDRDHPTGRRIQQKPANRQQLISKPSEIPTAASTTPTLPPAAPKPQMETQMTPPADIEKTRATVPTGRLPLPKPRPVVVIPPPAKKTIGRTRSESPVAGPSRPPETQKAANTFSPSSDSGYVEGRRLPGWPTLLKQQQQQKEFIESSLSDADGSEYLPEIKVKHDRGREEKVEEGKGKTKEEGLGGDKRRKPPQPTGELREYECRRCVEKEIACYTQKEGKACLGCATMKLKCEDVGETVKGKGKGVKTGPAATKKGKAGQAGLKTTTPAAKRSEAVKPAPAKPAPAKPAPAKPSRKPAPKANPPVKKGTRPSMPISLRTSMSVSEGETPPRKLRVRRPEGKDADARPVGGRANPSVYSYPVDEGKSNLYV